MWYWRGVGEGGGRLEGHLLALEPPDALFPLKAAPAAATAAAPAATVTTAPATAEAAATAAAEAAAPTTAPAAAEAAATATPTPATAKAAAPATPATAAAAEPAVLTRRPRRGVVNADGPAAHLAASHLNAGLGGLQRGELDVAKAAELAGLPVGGEAHADNLTAVCKEGGGRRNKAARGWRWSVLAGVQTHTRSGGATTRGCARQQ